MISDPAKHISIPSWGSLQNSTVLWNNKKLQVIQLLKKDFDICTALCHCSYRKKQYSLATGVADPGSDAFLTPGPGIRDR